MFLGPAIGINGFAKYWDIFQKKLEKKNNKNHKEYGAQKNGKIMTVR